PRGKPKVPPQALFGISVALGFLAWGIVAARYLWPYLRGLPRVDALRPLLVLHSFRFVGLAFLVPGVVAPELSAALRAQLPTAISSPGSWPCPRWPPCSAGGGCPWSGCSTCGAPPISSTLSIRAIPSGLPRVSWVPPTSFQSSRCRCS